MLLLDFRMPPFLPPGGSPWTSGDFSCTLGTRPPCALQQTLRTMPRTPPSAPPVTAGKNPEPPAEAAKLERAEDWQLLLDGAGVGAALARRVLADLPAALAYVRGYRQGWAGGGASLPLAALHALRGIEEVAVEERALLGTSTLPEAASRACHLRLLQRLEHERTSAAS